MLSNKLLRSFQLLFNNSIVLCTFHCSIICGQIREFIIIYIIGLRLYISLFTSLVVSIVLLTLLIIWIVPIAARLSLIWLGIEAILHLYWVLLEWEHLLFIRIGVVGKIIWHSAHLFIRLSLVCNHTHIIILLRYLLLLFWRNLLILLVQLDLFHFSYLLFYCFVSLFIFTVLFKIALYALILERNDKDFRE